MPKNSKSSQTVLWWIGWIVLTIASFFVSCAFWTNFIAQHVGPMQQKDVPILWVTAVFGSWIVLLIPLIIVMYAKVDKAYEDSRMAREAAELEKARHLFPIRSVLVDPKDRLLESRWRDTLKSLPETMKKGHLVHLVLRDGRWIENVFIHDKKEILGIYNAGSMDFKSQDIAGVEPADLSHLPKNFNTENWLRLDGVL
ncbi:MAG: hypothetical protein HY592_02825 [Candidatus Omnitrophica bacterium]|nr:hypothetical protein [Candidatus Omnitrophota bacterium]